MRDPVTDCEWQDAADVAHGALTLQTCKERGFVMPGIKTCGTVNELRCRDLLERGKARGTTPSPNSFSRFLTKLKNVEGVQHAHN